MKRVKKTAKKYLIPHKHNQYKPHIFRKTGVAALSFLIALSFLATLGQAKFLLNFDLTAAIFPSVLADFANDSREDNGLNGLKWNEDLAVAAQIKADDMASRGYFSHNTPDGKEPWDFIDEAGYDYLYAGENLAVDFNDSGRVHRAWLNSPGHRANILSENFTEIGIALANGTYEGRSTTFVVQMFGSPAPNIENLGLERTTITLVDPTEASGVELETVARSATDNELFVAVRSNILERIESGLIPIEEGDLGAQAAEGDVLEAEQYSNFFERLLSSPRETLTVAYIVIATFILVALFLAIFIEVRRQHPSHIMFAVFLILLIGIFFYLNKTFILETVSII